MDQKLKSKRLKYRIRPTLATVMHDLQDEKMAKAFCTCYTTFKVDYLMGSYAFELLRLKWVDYMLIFAHQYNEYIYEIRETCSHAEP